MRPLYDTRGTEYLIGKMVSSTWARIIERAEKPVDEGFDRRRKWQRGRPFGRFSIVAHNVQG